MPTLRTLLDRQTRELDNLTDDEARKALRIFDTARRELAERLDDELKRRPDPHFTAFELQRTLAIVEQGIGTLQARLGVHVDAATEAARRSSLSHLEAVIGLQEPEMLTVGGDLNIEILRRLSADGGTLLHRYSVQRYGAAVVNSLQGHLVQGVAQRLTWVQLRERVFAAEGAMAGFGRARAELIVRNEMSNAYNGAHLAGIRAHAERDPPGTEDPLQVKISEYLDRRSHPISWMLDGQTRTPDGKPFRARIADVQARAAMLGKRLNGVLWRREGAFFVGENLPAHHWERGRVHAWRDSWSMDD